MKAIVEFTYSLVVEVPDEAGRQEAIDVATPYHERFLDEGTDPPSHIEVTWLGDEEEKDYLPVNTN
ncbi:MAG: hypothetical protein K6T83_03745 [Alicyclobacillus sp.]|nr:hypothetical protein [Alicyclobacillus sp.]